MNVSVIVTVYNESASIDRLLDSLARQSRPPDEIVICDGGSCDDTVARIKGHKAKHLDGPPIHLLIEPGANISRGRNLAIAAARGPVIAVTDAGTRLSTTWLAELTSAWSSLASDDGLPLAVAGFFLPDTETWFEIAMAATVLPQIDEIAPERFLPSSRSVAFLKDAWTRVGGYPEWLDYCEDLIFDIQMNDLQPYSHTAFVWSPRAVVYFRPRGSLASFWTQYYRYARGDGRANLWRKRHALRYAVYVAVGPLLLVLGLVGNRYSWLAWLAFVSGALLYCRRPWLRLAKQWDSLTVHHRIMAAATVPVIRMVGDFAKIAGYPVGLWWRWQNRERAEIYWRQAEQPISRSCGADTD